MDKINQKKLKEFLNDNEDLLNSYNFEKLYEKVNGSVLYTVYLTVLLYSSGIDPLSYMSYVPKNFLHYDPESLHDYDIIWLSSNVPTKIIIPKNIKVIQENAFRFNEDVKNIVIESSDITFSNNIFNFMDNITIEYNGTFKDFVISYLNYRKQTSTSNKELINLRDILLKTTGTLECIDDSYNIVELTEEFNRFAGKTIQDL